MASAEQFLNEPGLKQQVIEEYRASGYVILSDVYDERVLSSMRKTWQNISEERGAHGKKPFVTLLMAHNAYPEVADIVRHRPLVKCVEGLLGSRVEMIQSQLMFGAPGTSGFSPHQDNFYNRADPNDGIIAAWIALEPVDQQNGGLGVYPGSHKKGLVETRQDWLYLLSRSPDILKSLVRLASPRLRAEANDSGVMERFVYALPPTGLNLVGLSMEPGSVVFMHGDLIHSSFPNRTTDRARRSLLANYVRVGTSYASGRLTGRTRFELYPG
ncbi:MAG: hypothetical protein EXR86_15905 [Gammaproteobacteria bacterium]|nr:hypothetical protein [Gammaproteobacteria bacterium]